MNNCLLYHSAKQYAFLIFPISFSRKICTLAGEMNVTFTMLHCPPGNPSPDKTMFPQMSDSSHVLFLHWKSFLFFFPCFFSAHLKQCHLMEHCIVWYLNLHSPHINSIKRSNVFPSLHIWMPCYCILSLLGIY